MCSYQLCNYCEVLWCTLGLQLTLFSLLINLPSILQLFVYSIKCLNVLKMLISVSQSAVWPLLSKQQLKTPRFLIYFQKWQREAANPHTEEAKTAILFTSLLTKWQLIEYQNSLRLIFYLDYLINLTALMYISRITWLLCCHSYFRFLFSYFRSNCEFKQFTFRGQQSVLMCVICFNPCADR